MVPKYVALPLLLSILAGAPACTSRQVTYLDPVEYCAAVGAIDHPDERYVGPASPEWMADAMVSDLGLGQAAMTAVTPVVWRCSGGSVVACSPGLGMACNDKADGSRVPTKVTLEFCRAFPEIDRPLPSMGASPSIYAWGCHAGWPRIIGTRHDLDADGYPRRYWLRVTPGPGFTAKLDPHSPDTPIWSGNARPARSSTSASVSPI